MLLDLGKTGEPRLEAFGPLGLSSQNYIVELGDYLAAVLPTIANPQG